MPSRFVLKLALLLGGAVMCLVPGDAVARPNDRGSGSTRASQVRVLQSDMSQPSERQPQGVPSWFGWSERPRAHWLPNSRSFHAFTAWGQLYQCAAAPSTLDATVDLRNLQAWVLLRHSSRWRRIQFSSDVGGAAFAEDYAGPTVAGRYSASSIGTSVRLVRGHNFHFWPASGRVSLDAADVVAVTVALEARLAPDTRTVATPCFVLSVGGDLWSSLTAAPGGSSSEDVGIGRFKRVERRWRLFTMTTASPRDLRRVPLPVIAAPGEDF